MHPAPLLLGLQKIGAGPFGFGPPALGAMFKELATLVHVFQIQYLFRGRHVIKTCLFQQIRLVCNLALLGRSNNLIGMGGGETKYEIMINNCEFVGYKGNCMWRSYHVSYHIAMYPNIYPSIFLTIDWVGWINAKLRKTTVQPNYHNNWAQTQLLFSCLQLTYICSTCSCGVMQRNVNIIYYLFILFFSFLMCRGSVWNKNIIIKHSVYLLVLDMRSNMFHCKNFGNDYL